MTAWSGLQKAIINLATPPSLTLVSQMVLCLHFLSLLDAGKLWGHHEINIAMGWN